MDLEVKNKGDYSKVISQCKKDNKSVPDEIEL